MEALSNVEGTLITCEAVIAESCFLLAQYPQVRDIVLRNVQNQTFRIPFRLTEAAAEIRRTYIKYKDRAVDFADACLIHLATEMNTGDILTLDSDFDVYRWGANKRFRNLVQLR